MLEKRGHTFNKGEVDMSTPTLLMALLVIIVTLELIKARPVREVKVHVAEVIPILILGVIPMLGLVVTILVIVVG